MRTASGCARQMVIGAALVGMVATLAGCTALPGGALDPMKPVLGLPRGQGAPAQTPTQTPVPRERPDH